MPHCTVCKTEKTVSDFQVRSDTGQPRKQCRDCRSQQRKARYEQNRDKENAQALKRYYANREEEKAKRRAYYRKNREAYRERTRRWCKENRERVNEWERERRKTPYYRYREMLKSLVRRVSETDRSLLGYTADEFKAHIEQQFRPGMSWQNHGEWEIDHIKPVVAFYREGVTDPKIVNALSNLQPLWREENRKKSSKHVDPQHELS